MIQSDVKKSRSVLSSRSFVCLLTTQFLGTMNDNMFRWLAVPIGKRTIGETEALSLGLACFTLPYLLLASPAGFLADRFSKRTVIVGCKIAEIVIMVLGIAAILIGDVYLLFGVVALTGCQAALFGPAKYGSIPEILPSHQLSQGNGWMGMVTVVSAAVGCVGGNWLFAETIEEITGPMTPVHLFPVTLALVGVALAGWVTSLGVANLAPADPARKWPSNPIAETWGSLQLLGRNVPLLRATFGIAFFWMLASLAQLNIDVFGIKDLGVDQRDIGPLLGVLVVGVGVGSVLAGVWSGGKVELGIVPLGAAGIVVSSFLLWMTGDNVSPALADIHRAFYWSCLWLLLLGISAGLFDIPLEAFLQHRSEVQTRGTILAASNFISFSLILVASGLFWLMQRKLQMSASEIFLAAGLGTIPVLIYIVSLLPGATIRFLVWLASHTVYRVRVIGRDNLPETGGALLVANHVSWLDGILLLIASSRPIRMIAYADYVSTGIVGWLAKVFGVIPIKRTEGPKAILRSLEEARKAIRSGQLVCIFAEGEITRTGQLQPFQRGLMRIINGTSAPVVPVYLDGLWGSIFSFRGGKFFWKWPRQWPYPVSIEFGPPLADPDDVHQVQCAVQNLGVEAMDRRKSREPIPARLFLRKARRSLFRIKVADSSGAALTGGKLMAGTFAFKRLLGRRVLAREEKMVGLLLPPSVGAVIANTAVTLMGKVAVNLNYTLSDSDLNYCISQSNITHILTSHRVLEKRPFQLNAEFVFLEDLKPQITGWDKLVSAASAYLLPSFVLERLHGLTRINHDDLLTVIFTSGSTGEPKGVMLSHHNVLSNTRGVDELFHITSDDVLLGVLPFFHSFGYTGTLWLALTLDAKGVFHFNPLDGRVIGSLCEKYGVTIILSTPTFLRTYLKRCTPQQMHKLDLVIVGAEKMPLELAREFKEKFGVQPTEGYGTTELSPVAAVNVPDHRSSNADQVGTKLGTVGRLFPGVAARIIDPDSGAELPTNCEGLLLIKGPNVMRGYLEQPEKTALVLRDGWYNTGDMASIDDEGFVKITGRQSRFSKIGGEMVPHLRLEELLLEIAGNSQSSAGDEQMPEVQLAVTAVPDERKGERIVVLHRTLSKPVVQIIDELGQRGVPNLWIPSADSFVQVDKVPVLGTGKLDLKALKTLALEKFASGDRSANSEKLRTS